MRPEATRGLTSGCTTEPWWQRQCGHRVIRDTRTSGTEQRAQKSARTPRIGLFLTKVPKPCRLSGSPLQQGMQGKRAPHARDGDWTLICHSGQTLSSWWIKDQMQDLNWKHAWRHVSMGNSYHRCWNKQWVFYIIIKVNETKPKRDKWLHGSSVQYTKQLRKSQSRDWEDCLPTILPMKGS